MHLNHDGPLQSQRLKNFALHLPVCVVIMPTSQPVASLYAAADFFLEHGEHEKGVQLLMQACQFSRALDVCSHNSITLTEVGAHPPYLPFPRLALNTLAHLVCWTTFCLMPGQHVLSAKKLPVKHLSCSQLKLASAIWCTHPVCHPVNGAEMMTTSMSP